MLRAPEGRIRASQLAELYRRVLAATIPRATDVSAERGYDVSRFRGRHVLR
jgi:hypothetical protein